jgi:hypothetical protein
VSAFFSSLFSELGARRRRLRKALGDRGQSLFEMLVLGGLVFGSAGLFVQPWMAAAAPWGFGIPFVFVAAYCWLDVRRQAALKLIGDGAADESESKKVRKRHDLAALALAIACASAGAAAFTLAFRAKPPEPVPVEEPGWRPPEDAVDVEILPSE